MTSQTNLRKFDKIYDETYYDVLKFIVIKCKNINDANDILQDTYFEFWKILNKKDIENTNIKSYLLGIAVNKIKKHYSLIQKLKTISLFDAKDKDLDLVDIVKSNINIENLIVKNSDWNLIWEYVKNMKNKDIVKIFYLYYKLDLSIKEISKELDVGESYVKNLIYRTLKELSTTFGK